MALHYDIRVPIPDKTYFKKQNSCRYIYLYTSFFRKNGKPSNTSVVIGKVDNDSGLLIPNDTYYKYFDHSLDNSSTNVSSDTDDSNVYEGVKSIGYTAVVNSICEKLELDSLLESSFEGLSDDIINTAGYMIREGSVMSYIDDYMEHNHSFNKSDTLSNQNVSELFSDISYDSKCKFFKEWVKKAAGDDCVAYDVTSISTYSNNITQAEYGYNRDHDDLKQINIGLFTAIRNKLPVYYNSYNGSLTDKSNVTYVMNNAKEYGIDKVSIVMDGGFFDDKKLSDLNDMEIGFTVGMPAHLDISKEILDKYRNEVYKITNCTSYDFNYAMNIDYELFGIKGTVMIGLNTLTRDLMMKSLKKDIAKREKELHDKKIKKYETVIKKKRYTELFDIEPLGEKDYTYKLKEDKVEEYSKNYGYFLIFSVNKDLSANDILYYYRQKDIDEKMFYQLKDYMGARRMNTQNQETTDGKIFVLFIALIIRSYMYEKLREYKQIHHLTFERCMRKLGDIQVVKIKGKKPRLVKEITKQQRELLGLFDIDIEVLMELVS